MSEYFVIAERRDRDNTYIVYWGREKEDLMPAFSCRKSQAIRFTEAKAKACVKYLMHESKVNGKVCFEACRVGRDAVFNIKAVSVKLESAYA